MAPVRFECAKCGKSCGRKANLKRHRQSSCEGIIEFRCSVCTAEFSREDNLNRHLRKKHAVKVRVKQSALGGAHECIVIKALGIVADPSQFLARAKAVASHHFKRILDSGGSSGTRYLLWWSAMEVSMEKPLGEQCTAHFTHKKRYAFPESDFDQELQEAHQEITKNLEMYQELGSGWVVRSVNHLDLHIVRMFRL